ncbi:VWA domain-containing protein [Lysinibacillus yapensis]|uniref:VWA domain-containing protein n=2 Tax=Ureibacillus yapensis TaxID=2304605 RepID=A0A396SEV9_9BACL|nr:VWA domain-containing protein [Lysinibacillus yapensis]
MMEEQQVAEETVNGDGQNPAEPTNDEVKNNENVIVGPSLPTNLEELADLPSGYIEYVNTASEDGRKIVDELTENLPDISGNPTNEELDQYFEAILSVFQQDYTGAGDIIDKVKFQSIGSPEIEDSRYQFKENLNVMVILDASGSMANYEGNVTRMEAAKNAIHKFVKALPNEANVGLLIYGHEGTGEVGDQALSCKSSELIYPISQYEEASFNEALKKATPAGWTPIGLALKEAQKDLAAFKGETNTNIVYLVSDGISTCEDDPVGTAKSLYDSDITPIVNVIGFNVDQEGQKQLQDIAAVTEGTFQHVTDAQGLEKQLNEANKVAGKWKQWKSSQADNLAFNKVDNWLEIFTYHGGEFGKWVVESLAIELTLTYLYQHHDAMSEESHDYLQKKNSEYHNWVEEQYDRLRADLEAMNEMNYEETVKQLEEKYLTNTSNTP